MTRCGTNSVRLPRNWSPESVGVVVAPAVAITPLHLALRMPAGARPR
jgi:hypothetical protein